MSYSEDAVNAKLSALNETQESIVTTAQWVMFHRRYADRTIKLWLDKLGTSSPAKRLNLIYLINEVGQQSKFRKREEFRAALAAVIADGVSVAYTGATNDIKNKIKRVIDVWKDREIFEENVRDDIDRRVDAIDRKRGEVKRPLLGSGSAGAAPAAPVVEEIQDLSKLYLNAHKASEAVRTTRDAATGWEDSMNSFAIESTNAKSAAKITAIHNRLAHAHVAAVESVLAREAIIRELEKLLEANKKLKTEHELLVDDYNDKKERTFEKKTEIENGLLAKMHLEGSWAPLDKPGGSAESNNGYQEPERPQVEALTPPPLEMEEDDYDPPEASDAGNRAGTPPAVFGFDDAEEEDDTNHEDEHLAKKRKLGAGFGSFMGSKSMEQDVDDLIRSEGGASR